MPLLAVDELEGLSVPDEDNLPPVRIVPTENCLSCPQGDLGADLAPVLTEPTDEIWSRALRRENGSGLLMIRVLVVDDFPPMRKTLIEVLQTYPDVEVVGEGRHGIEAWELAHTKRPDVILMDVRMPVCDGIEAARMVKGAYPEMIVVGLTADEDALAESAMREAGADAFVLKGAVVEHLEVEILKAMAKQR